MNDHELDLALADCGATRVQSTAPPMLRQRIGTMPLPSKPRRAWLPPFPKWRSYPMFSALKFIAASVIVALFGGFLLTGIFTTQQGDELAPAAVTGSPSPMTAEESLSGMLTEKVGPGIYRVVSDGVRSPFRRTDVEFGTEWDERSDWLLAGLDGSVWLKEDQGLVELGEEGQLPYPKSWYGYEIEVAADGTPWIAAEDRLYAHDGGRWRLRLDAEEHVVERSGTIEFRTVPDGSVWVLLRTDRPGGVRFRRFDGEEWTKLQAAGPADAAGSGVSRWLVRDDGDVWILRGRDLYHFDGRSWEAVAHTRRPTEFDGDFVVTPDGQVRVFYGVRSQLNIDAELGHVPVIDALLADGEWALLDVPPLPDWSPGLRDDQAYLETRSVFTLAPDGTFWRNFTQADCRPGTGGLGCELYVTVCDGLARFDGDRWTRYLGGLCVEEVDFGPDGSVWVRASTPTPGKTVAAKTDADPSFAGVTLETLELGPNDLYVITPEAVAAAE